MKVKLNKFERVAGAFVLAAIVGSLTATVGVAVQKGWFASKVRFTTVLDSAGGLHNGTQVLIAGLRAGSVSSVELVSANKVKVTLKVFKKFHRRIREDSVVQVVRPFVIGEKVLEISVGSEKFAQAVAGAELSSQSSIDIMDVFSGRKLGPVMETVEGLAHTLKTLARAFSDPKRSAAIVKIFDRLDPLLGNLVSITNSAVKHRRFDKMFKNLTAVTVELNTILPEMRENSPELGVELSQLIGSLNTLTEDFKKLSPTIAAVAPDLPKASLRGLEALNEAVVLLKAMQRSFFLSSRVKEVLEEERKLNEDRKRLPASE